MPTESFTYTGAAQTFVVPEGITLIRAYVYGASGGGWGGSGLTKPGEGGWVACDLVVTPGEELEVYVGGAGGPNFELGIGGAGGGWNGGGDGVEGSGGAGGGATDIRRVGTKLIIAGGGGGRRGNGNGGNGGYPNGQTGVDHNDVANGGGGGTSSAGGAGAGGAGAGTLGQGGAGDAGGGGGYYGGGGSTGTGTGNGGGGSGYASGTNIASGDGGSTEHGYAYISWEAVVTDEDFNWIVATKSGIYHATAGVHAERTDTAPNPGSYVEVAIVVDTLDNVVNAVRDGFTQFADNIEQVDTQGAAPVWASHPEVSKDIYLAADQKIGAYITGVGTTFGGESFFDIHLVACDCTETPYVPPT